MLATAIITSCLIGSAYASTETYSVKGSSSSTVSISGVTKKVFGRSTTDFYVADANRYATVNVSGSDIVSKNIKYYSSGTYTCSTSKVGGTTTTNASVSLSAAGTDTIDTLTWTNNKVQLKWYGMYELTIQTSTATTIIYIYLGDTSVQAVPTSCKIYVNGEVVSFDAYLINNNNYFKLRDIAYALNSTKKQFNVTWDSATDSINLVSNTSYTIVGGEMGTGKTATATGTPSSSAIYLDGSEVSLTAYLINSNNYFKLRDLGELFDFNVTWDSVTNSVYIDTTTSYTED